MSSNGSENAGFGEMRDTKNRALGGGISRSDHRFKGARTSRDPVVIDVAIELTEGQSSRDQQAKRRDFGLI